MGWDPWNGSHHMGHILCVYSCVHIVHNWSVRITSLFIALTPQRWKPKEAFPIASDSVHNPMLVL
jgi:hypothetical protein